MKSNWDKNKAIVRFLSWLFYTLVIPLLPLLFGMLIAYLQAKNASVKSLLSGTELFLLSLIVWASTKDDFDYSDIDIKKSVFYAFLSRFFLPLMIMFSGFAFAAMYIHERVADIGLQEEITVNVALVAAITTSVVCVLIQLLISKVNATLPAQKETQNNP